MAKQVMQREYWSAAQLEATYAGIRAATWRRWCIRGRIRGSIKIGPKLRLIPDSEVKRLLGLHQPLQAAYEGLAMPEAADVESV
jgi:predicted site-specific integrase-resolvase